MKDHCSSNLSGLIMELLTYFTLQYGALFTMMDSVALIFEELHTARAEVMDDGQHNPGMFLWGF
jgi:predicted HAD superfamily Cof-like phosphohydrolase